MISFWKTLGIVIYTAVAILYFRQIIKDKNIDSHCDATWHCIMLAGSMLWPILIPLGIYLALTIKKQSGD